MDEDNQQPVGLFNAVTAWWKHPFNSGGSALNWVLFVGILVIAAFLWNTVLQDLVREV